MSYDIFKVFGLDKIHDSMTEDYDYKDNDPSIWKLVKSKQVLDSDGFQTDYTWYTDGKKHIFMFGDSDITEPDPDYSDWEADTEEEAQEWFNSYTGFADELDSDEWSNFEEDDFEDNYTGDADFINEGFLRTYGEGKKLED